MKRKLNKKTNIRKVKKGKDSLISYRVTAEQYNKAIKIGEVYGVGPHEWARGLFTRAIPEEEKKLFGKPIDLEKKDLKSNLHNKSELQK